MQLVFPESQSTGSSEFRRIYGRKGDRCFPPLMVPPLLVPQLLVPQLLFRPLVAHFHHYLISKGAGKGAGKIIKFALNCLFVRPKPKFCDIYKNKKGWSHN